jgi:hypothetical protein
LTDRLYLLRPGFMYGGQGPYCGNECALVEGMLSFFPELRSRLDVRYVEFQRPRPPIVAELGPDHQSAPVLVLDRVPAELPPTVEVRQANGRAFIDDEHAICDYLAFAYRKARPHH